MGTIRVEHIPELMKIVKQAIMDGLEFKVTKDGQSYWVVEFTGGY